MDRRKDILTDSERRKLGRVIAWRIVVLVFASLVFSSSIFIVVTANPSDFGDVMLFLYVFYALYVAGSGYSCFALIRSVARIASDLRGGESLVETGSIEDKGSFARKTGNSIEVDGVWTSCPLDKAVSASVGDLFERISGPASRIILSERIIKL